MKKRFLFPIFALVLIFAAFIVFHTTAQAPIGETERVYAGYQVPMRAGNVIYTGLYHNYLLAPIQWTDSAHFLLYIEGVEVNGIYPATFYGHDHVVCAREALQAGQFLFEVVRFHNDCF
jgi:hypothetical protein